MVLLLLFLVGVALGGQLNWAIYRWAWNQRNISPWSAAPQGLPPRRWTDRIPILGWWWLRRESPTHGQLFWLRPMLLEVGIGIGLPYLYWWEMNGNQLPVPLRPPAAGVFASLLATFVANSILFALMTIATFIDIDEKTIPDFVTVPGTLLALLLALCFPHTLLPVMPPPAPPPAPVLLTSPGAWPATLDSSYGLLAGLCCWWGWCYGLLPKTVYTRRGLWRAARFLCASMIRHPLSKWIGLMAILGSAAIGVSWWWAGPTLHWHALLSSLVGLAFAGGLVWLIRVVCGYVLGVEAMGFGDVTLMAMIGAFLGWQAAILAFFLAPFTSLAIAVSQYVLTGRRDIPFGPFLCAAAAIVMVFWEAIWASWGPHFSLGAFIPLILLGAIGLMAVLLALVQAVKRLFVADAG